LGPGGVSEDWQPDYSQMDGPQQEDLYKGHHGASPVEFAAWEWVI